MNIDGHLLLADVVAISAGRFGATVAAFVGLGAVILGVIAVRRAEAGTTTALVLGGLGVVLGGYFVATADGGLGTGNGLGGAVVAVVLGVIGLSLGAFARLRPAAG